MLLALQQLTLLLLAPAPAPGSLLLALLLLLLLTRQYQTTNDQLLTTRLLQAIHLH